MNLLTELVLVGECPALQPVTFKAAPGKAVVACGQSVKSQGLILLTDDQQDKRWPDIGTVLSCDDIEPGSKVVIEPYVGTIVADFQGFEYVRFLGAEGSEMYEEPIELGEHIVAIMEGTRLRPYGKRLLVRLNTVQEKVGEIYLPDSAKKRDNTATVLEVGSDVKNFRPGQTVAIRTDTVLRIGLGPDFEEAYSASKGGLGFIFEENVYGEIETD